MNTAIKCGKCKGIHTSVQDVRACYAGAAATQDDLLPCERNAIASGKVRPEAKATDKQIAFIKKLSASTNTPMDATQVAFLENELTKFNASAMIDNLLKLKPVQVQGESVVAAHNVPEGYYAVEGDPVKFYRVDCPTDGKWAGRTFVSVQASDDFHAIRDIATRTSILGSIEGQGVKECSIRYGHLIGRCYVCNRTLTDELSRQLGIGPVCRNK